MKASPPQRRILERFPGLVQTVPWIDLGRFPTPIQRLQRLEQSVGSPASLWMKRDDLSGRIYGSNKVRKLEILLGQALHRGKARILTFGALGSNHVLACLLYARELGLKSTAVLFPQPMHERPLRNLKADTMLTDRVLVAGSMASFPVVMLRAAMRDRQSDGQWPFVIPMGGSSPATSLGYAEAVLELQSQVEDGQMPEPDTIILPLGSCGTAAGVALGLGLSHLKSQLVPVRVVDKIISNGWRAKRMAQAGARLIERAHPVLRESPIKIPDFKVVHDYFGRGYAFWTEKGRQAVARVLETENIQLETTYTGKAMACALDMAQGLPGKTLLFWNTFGSVLPSELGDLDAVALPEAIQRVVGRCPNGEQGIERP